MKFRYNLHIIYKILCKWTYRTYFSGEWLGPLVYMWGRWISLGVRNTSDFSSRIM